MVTNNFIKYRYENWKNGTSFGTVCIHYRSGEKCSLKSENFFLNDSTGPTSGRL